MDTARPILVTGAAGFIGYHLCAALLSEGRAVVGMDSVNDYYPPLVKRRRLGLLEGRRGFTFVEADLADRQPVDAAFATHRPEIICHLAAQAGVRYSLDHPRAYTSANVEGTLNILEACRHAGAKRLVYASSSSVYGGNKKVPFSEDDRVDNPISLYAATKKSCELMAHTYTHLFGLQTVGLRFFTVYGRWGRPDMAIWIFTEKVLGGRPIQVFGHGQMKRDFTHVSDITRGVTAALFADGLDNYEVFNLGNCRSEDLMDMIATVEQACGIEAVREYQPMQPGDVPATYADVSRARAKLGFEPSTPISEGIPDFVEWYRGEPEIAATVREWRG